jgi:hypothetical protein
MTLRKLHKIVGFGLTIPLLAWALTGIVFLTKPGYDSAYERLSLKTYPLEKSVVLNPPGQWHQARLLKTVLGYHLLLERGTESVHVDPITLQKKDIPTGDDLMRLITDAIGQNSARYGTIISVSGQQVITSTDVTLSLKWHDLTISQSGKDTRLLNTLYKIHYLQWWGDVNFNTLFGALGIAFLLLLVALGLAVSRSNPP